MSTFNVNPNQTYNAGGNKTYGVNKTYNATPNKTFNKSANRTFEVSSHEAYGPDEGFNPNYNLDEKLFLGDLEILCTDIRWFITSMYKFFCDNYHGNCRGVRKAVAEIDTTAQTIINELFIRQMEIEDMREATVEESVYDEDSYDAFEPTSASYDRSGASRREQEFSANRSILNETRNRLNRLSINQRHANSLIEGLRNVEQTEQNLRRFRAMDSLQNIFGPDDDDNE